MTRTAWMFTLGNIWAASNASTTQRVLFVIIYFGVAYWSWYREAKHKEEVHV